MMDQHHRTEPLFYYFRLEDQVPEHHPLREIDHQFDFGFVREQLRAAYNPDQRDVTGIFCTSGSERIHSGGTLVWP